MILDGGKKSVTGPGGESPTGIGVWVHHPFASIFIEFRGSVISGWDVGLLIEGRQIFADDFLRIPMARRAWNCTTPKMSN